MNLNDIPDGTLVECEINMGDTNGPMGDTNGRGIWKYARGHILHNRSDTSLVFDPDFNPTRMSEWYLSNDNRELRRDHRNLKVLDKPDKVKKDESLVPYSYTN